MMERADETLGDAGGDGVVSGGGEGPDAGVFVAVALAVEVTEGGLKRVEVGGRLILLAKVGGVIYAVDDDCTHISGPLDAGVLEGCVLTCPLHLARFDVRTGAVLRGPARDDLPTYAARVERGMVFVAVP